MKNKLIDLNDHLFSQIERLCEESLDPTALEREIARTDAIVKVSAQIIDNATVALRAAELIAEHGGAGKASFEQAMPMIVNDKSVQIEHKKK